MGLNVGRTHDVMDTSCFSRIIATPALCSGGPELRPLKDYHIFFKVLLRKAESVKQFLYRPHLCTSFL